MDGNIFRKIEIQKLKILFVYDHVLREPDLFILKKALEYKNKFKKYIEYRQVKEVEVHSEKTVTLCLDGEIIEANDVTIINYQKKLKFYIPRQ